MILTHDDNSHLSHFLWYKKKKKEANPWRVQATLTVIVISVKAVSLFKRCLWKIFLAGLVLFMLLGISGCSRSWKAVLFFVYNSEKREKLACWRRWPSDNRSHKRTEVETVDWPQSLFSGCFLSHVLFLSTSASQYWMEDIIFRQEETKRHICNNCPIGINMAEKHPMAFGMLQLKNVSHLSWVSCLSPSLPVCLLHPSVRCSVFLSWQT